MPGKAEASAPSSFWGEGAIAWPCWNPRPRVGRAPLVEAGLPQRKPRALVLHPAAAVKVTVSCTELS